MLAVKVRGLIGKEWDSIIWDEYFWEYTIDAENHEPSDSQGFISSEEVVSLVNPLKYFPFTGEINLQCLLNQQWLFLKEMPVKTSLMSFKKQQ